MDAVVTAWINGLAGNPLADALMRGAASYGVPLIVALVALQWWSRAQRLHLRHVAIVAGLAFVLGLAINQGVLLAVHRVRPYDAGVTHLLIAQSADWSFPSDHATASFAAAFAFLLQGVRWRGLGLVALAGLIGLSRVYLGIHYAGDILGGIVTAGLAALLVTAVWREGNRVERALVRKL